MYLKNGNIRYIKLKTFEKLLKPTIVNAKNTSVHSIK